jgi:biopolymer transport protein ExbD
MLKKSKRVGISIDMTPMCDVAFLLLIFFMTTTQFRPPEKDRIDLPQSSSDLKAPQSDIITIGVTKDGRMSMEYQARTGHQSVYLTDAEDLRAKLEQARIANSGARILVKVDKDANYGIMQEIMQVLQDQNATRFNIITDLKASGGLLGGKG